MMTAVQMLSTVPSFGDFMSMKVDMLSDLYETKVAFLAITTSDESACLARSAGFAAVVVRDARDDDRGVYGPSQHRKLGAQWTEKHTLVNEALQAATGYELHELTDSKTIERCMALTGPAAHPALYSALMKLYRLQLDIERTP